MITEITSPAIIHCGAGACSRIAGEAARLGTRAVVVTGRHLHGLRLLEDLLARLEQEGVKPVLAEPVTSEPTVEMVDVLVEFVRSAAADVMVAIGGGSVMDTAKAAAVMATNDGITEDYQLKRREIANPPITQVFVPTTAGTGSEATRVSVLTNERVGVKRSISHPVMTPDVVILDPDLLASLPLRLTTLTAMDAFSHAIESAVSVNATSYTRHVALAAIEQLCQGLPKAQSEPGNPGARTQCLQGSCFAGLAMQAGLGASHSLAPAVCIVAGIRHSEAIAALLPHVITLNERNHPGCYDEVARAIGTREVAGRLQGLCRAGGFENNLSQFGVSRSDWGTVCEAMNRYGSHRRTNPVEVTDDYARQLFEASLAT